MKKSYNHTVAFCILVALGAFPSIAAIERLPFDKDWKFRVEGTGAWEDIALPHDWSIKSSPFEEAITGRGGGYYPTGTGLYIKEFTLTEEDAMADLCLVFDGVYRQAEVSLNDRRVFDGSAYGYTGFEIPLTFNPKGRKGCLRAQVGVNHLRVVVRNGDQPNCRWYSGSGIFRHVWLEKRTGEWPEDIRVTTSNNVATISGRVGGKAVSRSYTVENVELWSPENPKLYTFDFYGEQVNVGFRTLAWSFETGLELNGKPIKLHGACVHHDHGPLGAASYDAAERRKVRQLKRAGFNAVRTSHNPVSRAFLDACDEEGLLVMNDLFDGWRARKNIHDYHEIIDRDWKKDLTWILKRDRNHPSIVMWSVGNEVIEIDKPECIRLAQAMVEMCHKMDGTRPVTSAIDNWMDKKRKWPAIDPFADSFDVAGLNYLEHHAAEDRVRKPGRMHVFTETFPKDAIRNWRLITEQSQLMGEFVWTGIDYLGEASIGRYYYKGVEPDGPHFTSNRLFPWHGAYCGDIDLTGWRKPISHLRETLWNDKAPTYLATREPNGWRGDIQLTEWAVWPTWESWNYEGWEGKPVTVEVYSRQPSVTLKLNGKELGTKTNGAENGYCVTFEVPYAPGILKAVAGDECAVLKTAGAFDHFVYDEETVGDLTWVVATAVDKEGTVCPNAEVDVTFTGDVLATCSANMKDSVAAPSCTRRTWKGRAMAVIRKGNGIF
ncbi:MAG: glycoside hydrolase family 2 TIM barrel-domain containing protein [Kiritimatiellia bacterium]